MPVANEHVCSIRLWDRGTMELAYLLKKQDSDEEEEDCNCDGLKPKRAFVLKRIGNSSDYPP